ncbi:hypothetical protein PQR62_07435 [Herbaspirillum lusitanum]|uniref:Uncharacterized protein n=1 Tax=Herbaspirillum lusitanum TaxID=213312 RepID=A0ABW9A7Z7_9BURK
MKQTPAFLQYPLNRGCANYVHTRAFWQVSAAEAGQTAAEFCWRWRFDHFNTESSIMRIRLVSYLFSAFTMVLAADAFAVSSQSDFDRAMSPHASSVRIALVNMPGESGSAMSRLADARSESSSCRTLRLQMNSAGSGEPTAQRVLPGYSRDGRFPAGVQTSSEYGERAKLEARHYSECR